VTRALLDDKRIAAVEIPDPADGIAAHLALSPAAPELSILRPAADAAVVPEADGRVTVEWRGTGAGGRPLRYTVLYSPNGGTTWLDQAFEQTGTTLRFAPEGGTRQPMLRVIASDGTRSRTATIAFTIAPR
jgi:hypothetical protein